MSEVKKGTHSEALGIKKFGKPAVDLLTDLISLEFTLNPASLATVTGALSADIAVTGAQLGDRVEVFPPYSTQGIMVFGYVSAADVVKLSFFNPTAGTIDLGSGDWIVHVIRP